MTTIKKRYKLKYNNIFKILIILLIPIVVFVLYNNYVKLDKKEKKKINKKHIEERIKEEDKFKLNYSKTISIPKNILDTVSNSNPSIVISDENGIVLANTKENDRREGASTTKIFIGYAALKLLDLEKDKIIESQYSLDECNPYCNNRLETDEKLDVIEASTYVFPDSSNSVATDIAIAIGKKYNKVKNEEEAEEKGLTKINEFIKELGCTNTHLGNANGLNTTPKETDNNFEISTGYPKDNSIDGMSANDLALVTTLAMKDNNFAQGIKTNSKIFYIKSGKGFFCHGVWGFSYNNKMYYITILGVNCNKGDDKNLLVNSLYNWTIKDLIN